MFDIKILISTQRYFEELVKPAVITVRSDTNKVIVIIITNKNSKQDFDAVVNYLIRINADAKSKNIEISYVQKYIDLLTGNKSDGIRHKLCI